MPSDAKKKRDAKKKEAQRSRGKKPQENGEENGVKNGATGKHNTFQFWQQWNLDITPCTDLICFKIIMFLQHKSYFTLLSIMSPHTFTKKHCTNKIPSNLTC